MRKCSRPVITVEFWGGGKMVKWFSCHSTVRVWTWIPRAVLFWTCSRCLIPSNAPDGRWIQGSLLRLRGWLPGVHGGQQETLRKQAMSWVREQCLDKMNCIELFLVCQTNQKWSLNAILWKACGKQFLSFSADRGSWHHTGPRKWFRNCPQCESIVTTVCNHKMHRT